MNPQQQAHLKRIHEAFIKEHGEKFEKGTIEHKSQLHEDFTAEQLLSFAIEEVLDMASYLYTLREILGKDK